MSDATLVTVSPPDAGVWRVARAEHGLGFPPARPTEDLDEPAYRFDDLSGATSTLYFASTPEAALTEVIVNALKPDLKLAHLLPEEDSIGVGVMTAQFLAGRKLFRAEFEPSILRPSNKFVDLELAANLAQLSKEMHPVLLELVGVRKSRRLTLAHIHGEERPVTRAIAAHIAAQRDDRGSLRYSGIRYVSKFGGDHECWAAFNGTRPNALETVVLDKHHPAVEAVAQTQNIRFN